jgi:hypothetical protein
VSSNSHNDLAAAVVPEAIDLALELRKHRLEKGMDAEYFKMARPALGFIGIASRILATIQNSRTNDLVERRLRALEAGAPPLEGEEPKAITDGATDGLHNH